MDKKTIIEETEKYYLPVFGRYPMVMELGQGCRVYESNSVKPVQFRQLSRNDKR